MHFRRLCFLILLAVPARGWPDTVDFTLSGGVNVPLAVFGIDSTAVYTWGEGVAVTADYRLPFLSPVFLEGITAFDRLNIRSLPGSPLDALAAGGGAGVTLELADRLRVKIAADAGYLAAAYGGDWSSSYFLLGSATLTLFLNPSFGFGAGAAYKMYAGLYSGAGVFLAATYRVKVEEMKD
jgi:hypothetical protein